jgi:hypothetical protein
MLRQIKIITWSRLAWWVVVASVAALLLTVSPAAAQQAPTNNSTDSLAGDDTAVQFGGNNSTGIGSLLGNESSGSDGGGKGNLLARLLAAVIWSPFRFLATQLLEMVGSVLTYTPRVNPNPAVRTIHSLTFDVALALTGTAVAAAGVLYIAGPVFGLRYEQVRMILPRIVVALGFAAVSLELLQYSVEITNLLTQAFIPSDLVFSKGQITGITVQLVVVWLVNAVLLLVVVVMFIIRDVYILFAAAISPLVALAWAFPYTKRYADSFIAGWWSALAMAPLDALVLRFVPELMAGGGSALQGVSNWVFGVAAFTLLILIPYHLYGIAQSAVGQAYLLSRGAKRRVRQYRNQRNDRDTGNSPPNSQRLPRTTENSRRNNKFANEIEEFR